MIAITEQTNEGIQGYVLYDGECMLCISLAARFRHILAKRRFLMLPLQTPWVRERLGVAVGGTFNEMALMDADGSIYGGAEAVLRIARKVWWGRPLWWVAAIPGMRPLFDRLYRWIARNRQCIGGSCRIPTVQG
jgi:predicted DCC family thiol-disulfide oxidoreductase YuxK